eukprot:SAG22_NODE_11027_length_504_cov_1.165432_1_plen_67_part_01
MPPRRHLRTAPLEGPGRSYPRKWPVSATPPATPRRRIGLESVVFGEGGASTVVQLYKQAGLVLEAVA